MTVKKSDTEFETVETPEVEQYDPEANYRKEFEEWKRSRNVQVSDAKDSSPEADEVPMIVHRVPFIDGNGVQQVKEHGPMPVADWPAYEKENNL